jgi:CRISPR-associated protein Cas5d
MAFGIKLHCWGEWACFTRPEMKVERVSYDVITPSAARGILEAIYWKPEIRWRIDRLTVLKPIQFTSVRRNEVSEKISSRTAEQAMAAGIGDLGLYVDDRDTRQQRASLLLRDVAYLIEAHFEVVKGEENEAKHLDQFRRRARRGQCYLRPFFGCREFAANFALVEDDGLLLPIHPALQGERDLGWMLHDIDFGNDRQPTFFRATMRNGVVEVPRLEKTRL